MKEKKIKVKGVTSLMALRINGETSQIQVGLLDVYLISAY